MSGIIDHKKDVALLVWRAWQQKGFQATPVSIRDSTCSAIRMAGLVVIEDTRMPHIDDRQRQIQWAQLPL